ncbi:MAG: serine/threonine protein kinase [Planctomycetes bacterium]|nr:serine/threonine protein kinase [Planctomycetota bacterium]
MLDTRTKVGPFALLKKLGEGPHGTTWLARRDGGREPQALKLLDLQVEREGSSAPLLRALQADVARLGPEHPNVVVPAEVGVEEQEGERQPLVYLASEFVDGPDLLKFTARAPWSTILEVVVSALRGLEAVHARGLVHGHVAANNVVIAGQGPRKTARLLDPGLAHEVALTRGAAATSWAPEVLRGEPLDRRADLYDLGVLLFECATREPLFGALEGDALTRAHLTEAPRKARDLKRSVPVAVEALIEALLHKDPAARPASANAVIRELNRTANKRFSTETREAGLPALLVPRLVGRQDELEELRTWAAPAAAPAQGDAPPAIVAVTGELGAGRSRLAQELRRALAGADDAPLWLQPRAHGARGRRGVVGGGRRRGACARARPRWLAPALVCCCRRASRRPLRCRGRPPTLARWAAAGRGGGGPARGGRARAPAPARGRRRAARRPAAGRRPARPRPRPAGGAGGRGGAASRRRRAR